MIIAVIILLVIVIVFLMLYNMSVHKKIDTYSNVSEIPLTSPPVARLANIIESISTNIATAGKINNFLMFIKGSPFVVILF